MGAQAALGFPFFLSLSLSLSLSAVFERCAAAGRTTIDLRSTLSLSRHTRAIDQPPVWCFEKVPAAALGTRAFG